MQNRKKIFRVFLFGLVFVLLFLHVQTIFQGAPVAGAFNPYTRVELFYRENHEPDVVVIGSSLAFEHFNPLVMFQEQGFTSYIFSAPLLGFEATDLYVEEAIKTYHPKVIVVETGKLIDSDFKESWTREWLDPIPFSVQKMETVQFVLGLQDKFETEPYDSTLSYIIPFLRYHDRWKSLEEKDFKSDINLDYYHGTAHYHGHGSVYFTQPQNMEHYYDKIELDSELLNVAKERFDEIVGLCKENEVELLLVQSPSPGWRKVRHDVIDTWAAEANVSFLDYVEDQIIDIDPDKDFRNNWHMNDLGSVKFSQSIGEYLKQTYNLPDHRKDSAYSDWEDDWRVYQQDKASFFLSQETDWANYIEKLQNSNYTIFFTVRDNLGGETCPELVFQLQSLGLGSDFNNAGLVGYVAVIDRGKVLYESMRNEPIEFTIDVNGQHVEMISKSYRQGNKGSIQLNGKEYFADHRGLGIVVYDNLLEDVVDCVTFDLFAGGKCYR